MSTNGDRFLGQPNVKVVLLGTFHFQDRGLDWYKPQFSFDVFSDRCQQEIADVVERLVAFGPTKIAIERTPDQQANPMERFVSRPIFRSLNQRLRARKFSSIRSGFGESLLRHFSILPFHVPAERPS